MANGLEVPKAEIGDQKIPGEILSIIPEESAEYYKFVPLRIEKGVLEVGIVDFDNIKAKDALNFISTKTKIPFKLFSISEGDFEKVIAMYRGLSEEVTKALSQLEGASAGSASVSFSSEEEPSGQDEENQEGGRVKKKTQEAKIIETAPITKIVATILRYATEGEASDVHIERMRENIRVRFRVDGVLNTSLILPAKVHSAIIARIKLLSNMKLDEKRKPQDGRFSAKIDSRKIDFRVSTFPTYFGEKIVMRILDQEKGVKPIDKLGLSDVNLDMVKRAIKKPYGLILISGPTGSGKTTTLYSILNQFDREAFNVLSLEDPIEYNIEGVNQSQIRADIGYTFANGLRTTLRQDPDIIMVGEIRDTETAQLAIQAALTGHLVLATIHTNNAVGVIPRLIDMKVDPYLIAPTLVLAVAQRLVSRLCPDAGIPTPIEGSIKIMIDKQFANLPEKYRNDLKFGKEVYRLAPSATCPSGTRGRVAVMEVFEMDKDVESAILRQASEIEIEEILRTKGMLTIREDALLKSSQRIVPFEEVSGL